MLRHSGGPVKPRHRAWFYARAGGSGIPGQYWRQAAITQHVKEADPRYFKSLETLPDSGSALDIRTKVRYICCAL